jgi:hypothetical protein
MGVIVPEWVLVTTASPVTVSHMCSRISVGEVPLLAQGDTSGQRDSAWRRSGLAELLVLRLAEAVRAVATSVTNHTDPAAHKYVC